jgi:hypothetical protein
MSAELASVSRSLGLELPGTLVFDYPTIDALAAYAAPLQAKHSSEAVNPGAPYPAAAPAPRPPARRAPDQSASAMQRSLRSTCQETPCAPSREGIVAIDACVGRFSEPACGNLAHDCTRVTPLERWDVDFTSPAVSHRPGSRFGRHVPVSSEPALQVHRDVLRPSGLVQVHERGGGL